MLFSRNKTIAVQSFLVKLINNHSARLKEAINNRREETRLPLAIVTQVIPVEDGKLQVEDSFPAVTKGFSSIGASIVLDQPRGLDELVLVIRWGGETTYLRGAARHLSPMGAGFYELGIVFTSVVSAGDHPELQQVLI